MIQLQIDFGAGTVMDAANAPIKELRLKRRDKVLVQVRFRSAFSPAGEERPIGTIGRMGIKTNTAATAFLAYASAWKKSGVGANAAYYFTLNLNTDTMQEAWDIASAGGAEVESLSAIAEVETEGGGEILSSGTIPVLIFNDVIRGNEGLPITLDGLVKTIILLDNVPSNLMDFSMFDGGVAPVNGVYEASDGEYIYRIQGGWSAWRRAPLAAWGAFSE